MKITGTVTKKEKVLVDIDPEALVLLVRSNLRTRGISIPEMLRSEDGTWEKYSYTHPHNGDDIYVPCDTPSGEELFWGRFIEELGITLRG